MLYASTAKTAIRLKHDGDKCEFMEQLNSLKRDLSGGTNTYAGKISNTQCRGDAVGFLGAVVYFKIYCFTQIKAMSSPTS